MRKGDHDWITLLVKAANTVCSFRLLPRYAVTDEIESNSLECNSIKHYIGSTHNYRKDVTSLHPFDLLQHSDSFIS